MTNYLRINTAVTNTDLLTGTRLDQNRGGVWDIAFFSDQVDGAVTITAENQQIASSDPPQVIATVNLFDIRQAIWYTMQVGPNERPIINYVETTAAAASFIVRQR